MVRFSSLALVSALVVSGCAEFVPEPEFGEVFISSRPRSAEIYSAHNGQFLGETPLTIRFDRSSNPFGSEVASIVARNRCGSNSEIFVIDRWFDDREQATINSNNILISIPC